MLTRLKISGFKNLVDVDVRFGPFTCIAGPNGVGKSNLFDAIHFLSALAEKNLIEAALSIRDEEGKSTNLRSLFHQYGDRFDRRMDFEAEMIVPARGKDEFGREAEASITFLKYSLSLEYKEEPDERTQGGLEIVEETLKQINRGDAAKNLLFPHDKEKNWLTSAIQGKGRRNAPFISTVTGNGPTVIMLHLDRGTGGKAQEFRASTVKRTILSNSNISESQTAWLAKQEMKSWRQLQLEPSSLRKPDRVHDPARLGTDGAHLPATLYRLAHHGNGTPPDPERIYTEVANQLAGLIDDVQTLRVVRDPARDLFILKIVQRDGTELDARSLSDGSLRFLALAVLELDPEEEGLICLEEPENGIHPERISSMLELLNGIATDVQEPIGADNPLRQVIINTHSPAVVQLITDDSLLVAESKEAIRDGIRFKKTIFSCLPQTWRDVHTPEAEGSPVCPRGKLLAYLNPASVSLDADSLKEKAERTQKGKSPRVVDRVDLQDYSLPWPPGSFE